MSRVYIDIDSGEKAGFCSLFGSLFRRGVPLLPAISLARDASCNDRMKEALAELAERVNSGDVLASREWLDKYPEFKDGLFDSYCSLGETIGELDVYLLRLATIYETARKMSPVCTLTHSEPLAIFTEIVADLSNVGLPILRALKECKTILANRRFPVLSSAVQDVIGKIEEGKTFSEALEELPEIFPVTYVAYFKAGETAGDLDGFLYKAIRRVDA
jgi:type II secretory pathway component PulF